VREEKNKMMTFNAKGTPIGFVPKEEIQERPTLTLFEAQKKIIKEVKLEQFKKFVENINRNMAGITTFGNMFDKAWIHSRKGYEVKNTTLGLIFDYDLCNEYAKIIIDETDLETSRVVNNTWEEKYYDIRKFKNPEERIRVAKSFIKYCNDYEGTTEKYVFMFWSLIILTVDNNRAEEHLSLICDFAKLLNITNDEFEDIIYVIKNIYNDVDEKYTFKSKLIPDIFNSILNLENKSV
jgi:hypothetical protein